MSSLLLYLLIFLIYNQVEIITAQTNNTTCNSIDGLFQGCSADLSALKLCINNVTIYADCSENKPYCNKETKSCEIKPQTSNKETFNCPSIDGFYPDPFDCKKYHQCYSGVPYEGNCNNNLIFNPKIPGCKKGICYTFSPENGLCRNKAGKIVTHPQDKNVYVYCQAQPLVLRCPADYIFDIKLVTCKYDCKTIGVFPDKEHYEWYYVCEKKGLQLEATHWKCPAGYYFNPYFSGCVYFL